MSHFSSSFQLSEHYTWFFVILNIFLCGYLIWIVKGAKSPTCNSLGDKEGAKEYEKTSSGTKPWGEDRRFKEDPKKVTSTLRSGLQKTTALLAETLRAILASKKVLDQETLKQLHEQLFRLDFGVQTTDKLLKILEKKLNQGKELSLESINEILAQECFSILNLSHKTAPSVIKTSPTVFLIVGVNGVGKTTTIAKLASRFLADGKSVAVCAADTFRAAAIDQIKHWGEKIGFRTIAQQPGSDPAAVAFDGVKSALAHKTDVLIIDTAGRLHNKQDLMAELAKIKRVIQKEIPEAPHETILILDATTGQNAINQVRTFNELVDITGLIITKLDGTAKGGIVLSLSHSFKKPVYYIGVGEKAEDLRPFDPREFANSLFSEPN